MMNAVKTSDEKEEKLAAERREVLVELFDKYYREDIKSVLDFGCGKGELVSILSERDLTLVGVDVDEASISMAQNLVKDRSNVTLEIGSLDAKAIKVQSFDAIIVSEVLEHLDDPEEYVRFFHGLLEEEKLLFILVPYLWELINCPRDAFINRALYNIRSDKKLIWEKMLFKVIGEGSNKSVYPRKYLRIVKNNFHDRYNLDDYVEAYMSKNIDYTWHKQWLNYDMLKDMLERNGFSILELKYTNRKRYMYIAAKKVKSLAT
jgi:SAM-dependent methyltransferase